MFWDPDAGGHGLPANPLKSCIVPRPIGWITTLNAGGSINLAPFSQFNLVGFEPGYLVFSASVHPPDFRRKDSVENAEREGEFVYNMATLEHLDAVNRSSAITERGKSEVEALGLATAPCRRVRTPRLAEVPVSLECRLHAVTALPANSRESMHFMVIGRVVGVHIADSALREDGRIDIARIKPLARLGYADYTYVDKVFEMPVADPSQDARRRYGFFGGR